MDYRKWSIPEKMATERIKLDTRGKNILQLFMENMPAPN